MSESLEVECLTDHTELGPFLFIDSSKGSEDVDDFLELHTDHDFVMLSPDQTEDEDLNAPAFLGSRPLWISDHIATNCSNCNIAFSLLYRSTCSQKLPIYYYHLIILIILIFS
jgi:hypothetical protein